MTSLLIAPLLLILLVVVDLVVPAKKKVSIHISPHFNLFFVSSPPPLLLLLIILFIFLLLDIRQHLNSLFVFTTPLPHHVFAPLEHQTESLTMLSINHNGISKTFNSPHTSDWFTNFITIAPRVLLHP